MLRLLRLFVAALVDTVVSRLRHGPARPSWGFRFEWVIRFLRRDFVTSAHWTYPRLRRDLNTRRYPSRAGKKVRKRVLELGGVPVVEFTPPEVRRSGVLLFLHGGSYIFGSPRTTHAEAISTLALRCGVRVLAPEYRLAPEHPYPAALEDALEVFAAAGVPPEQIVLAGDSAGGNLALAVQLARRDVGLPQANAAALISPWLDLTASRPSCRANDAVDYGNTQFLLQHARDFAGRVPLEDPRVSPLNAQLRGLAPVHVQVGTAERLLDESVEFVERARTAGVDTTIDLVPDMPHNSPLIAGFHPAAGAAVDRLVVWIDARLAMDGKVESPVAAAASSRVSARR